MNNYNDEMANDYGCNDDEDFNDDNDNDTDGVNRIPMHTTKITMRILILTVVLVITMIQ
jgi:hypothetical protein